MGPDDIFNIDSIAKTMTATLVIKLFEAGKLSLDDRAYRYLPDELVDGLQIYKSRDFSREITIS